MSEMKKVVVLNNEIINVGEMDEMPEGAVIEEREMEYTTQCGWREVGYIEPPSQQNRIAELENIILNLLMEV